jgi:hypothetical protein
VPNTLRPRPTFNSPELQRSRILVNAAECVACGHLLESLHVHDFRTHACVPRIWFMVDGGLSYLRRGWGVVGIESGPEQHYIERSIYAGPPAITEGPAPREHTAPECECPRCDWQRLHFNFVHHLRVRQDNGV